tara:strand:+ start:1066 stop:1347 length:282 start_codon:yes stop_codon:yes gene_type:complete
MIEEKITPWKTNLVGALVEFAPKPGRGTLFSRYGLSAGAKGVITDGEWVSNYSVGTAFCAYNILWMGVGSSRDFGCGLAHFSKKDFKVLALSG